VIVPDTADWTWVLRRRCGECGLEVSRLDRASLPGLVDRLAATWLGVLATRPPAGLVTRAVPGRWSPAEYGCHVEDVFGISGERIDLMITGAGPSFPNWDQDATAVEKDYAAQDPRATAERLLAAGRALATRLTPLGPAEWGYEGHRSNGSDFTIESYARYVIHDVFHHLWDVGEPFDL